MPIHLSFNVSGRSVIQDVFLETGLCRGITAFAAACMGFKEVHSIEIDPERWQEGVDNCNKRPGTAVTVHLGTSPDVLGKIIDRNKHTTIYLDGHYSGVPGEVIDPIYGECPLIQELRVIFSARWKANPIIVIDDSHMLARPWNEDLQTRFTESHWPPRNEVLKFLPGYDVVEENNCLYAFPSDCVTPASRRKGRSTGKRFTVTVPQGVGDILWVYQKLAPLCDEILFRVVEFGGDRPDIERRSLKTIAALPKVWGIDMVRVSRYPDVMLQKRRLKDLVSDLEAGVSVFWACNPWLEEGVPLEKIDPGMPIAWDVNVSPEQLPGVAAGSTVLYVSGDTMRHATLCEKVWTPSEWVRFVQLLSAKGLVNRKAPLVLIGAQFDSGIVDQLRREFSQVGIDTLIKYDLSLPQMTWLFSVCNRFISYQSGLSMVAATVGARQTMLYFPRILKMADSWVRPEHRGTGLFQYASFDQSPETVAAGIA